MKSRMPTLCFLLCLGTIILSVVLGDTVSGQERQATVTKKKVEDKFIRLLKDDKNKPVALQAAITTYSSKVGPYADAQVALVGAIHIGEKSYYAELNKRFKTYDAVLYEMVADANQKPSKSSEGGSSSPVSSVQIGMKDLLGLTFQLDEIDYRAKNLVHADMNPQEFSKSMQNRQEGIVQILLRSMGSGLAMQGSGKSNDLDLIGAFFSSNRELALKRALAEQFSLLEGQMAAIEGHDGKSTLITERNAKALSVLKQQLKAGKKKVAIFYGAGHFKHMDEELRKQFQLQPTKVEWLDAWDLR